MNEELKQRSEDLKIALKNLRIAYVLVGAAGAENAAEMVKAAYKAVLAVLMLLLEKEVRDG